jgi:hypothetical protein
VENLSTRLTEWYGSGFSVTTLQYFRKFYLAYPTRCSEIPRPLGVEFGSGYSVQGISHPPGVESNASTPIQYSSGRELPQSPKLSPTGRELMPTHKSSPSGTELPVGFSPQLSWSHYRALMRVENEEARLFYEREAIAGGWDKRTLER